MMRINQKESAPQYPRESAAKKLELQIFLSWRPVGRAKAAGLETLKDAKRLVDRASDVQVVDDRILQDAFRVDDEKPAKSNVRIVHQDVVFRGEASAYVRSDRVFDALNAVLVLRRLEPRAVRMDRVGRDTQDLCTDALDLVKPVRKMDQFRRADEREIERVEEQDEPFALVVRKLDVLGQR